MWRTRGHDAAVELLTSSLVQSRVSHAYLITGPDRIGKSRLARELAMALNCTTWQGPPQTTLFGGDPPAGGSPAPCYECSSCRKALAGAHPDILVVEEWTTQSAAIIDQVRAIQYASGLLPYEGRWKVYALLNAEGLTVPAQNALLKTLEEPAATVCLILTAPSSRRTEECRAGQSSPAGRAGWWPPGLGARGSR
jgi:DNA polymerase III gamma/tau subunit